MFWCRTDININTCSVNDFNFFFLHPLTWMIQNRIYINQTSIHISSGRNIEIYLWDVLAFVSNRWLTFLPDDDSFLRNGWACSSACFRIQIKLVARAVLEVGQSDRGLIGGQGQLLHWAQFIGVIYYRDGGMGEKKNDAVGWWKVKSSGVSWIEIWVGGSCRWSVNDGKGGNGSIWDHRGVGGGGSEIEGRNDQSWFVICVVWI